MRPRFAPACNQPRPIREPADRRPGSIAPLQPRGPADSLCFSCFDQLDMDSGLVAVGKVSPVGRNGRSLYRIGTGIVRESALLQFRGRDSAMSCEPNDGQCDHCRGQCARNYKRPTPPSTWPDARRCWLVAGPWHDPTRVSLPLQPLEFAPQIRGALIAQITVLFEQTVDDALQLGRQFGIH